MEETLQETSTKVEHKTNVVAIVGQIVLCVILAIVALFGGGVLGDFIIGKIDTFDPSGYNPADFVESQQNISLWQSQKINALSPTQVFVVAEANLKNCTEYSIYTKGYNGEDKGVVTTLGMKQDLYGYRYIKNGKGYFDYYSTGIANVVKKVEFKLGEDKYYCFNGTVSGSDTVWTSVPSSSGNDYNTGEEYNAMTGCQADNPIDYIVSTKTILEESFEGETNGVYKYVLKLNPTTSVLNYVKKMNYMSGLGYPKFTNIELIFEVDENMNFLNIYTNEDYKVIGMSANGKYKNEFHYDNIEER